MAPGQSGVPALLGKGGGSKGVKEGERDGETQEKIAERRAAFSLQRNSSLGGRIIEVSSYD